MPKINRWKDFQDGTRAYAEDMDTELNIIHDLLNTGIDSDNIKDNSILQKKLNFRLASNTFRGLVATYNDLNTITDKVDGDLATVKGGTERGVYMYNNATGQWEKQGGSVPVNTHNMMAGRDVADTHPITAITGLRSELDTITSRIDTKDNTVFELQNDVQEHENEITQLQYDETILNAKIDGNTTNITSQGTRIGTLETKVTDINTNILPAHDSRLTSLENNKYNKSGGVVTGDVTIEKDYAALIMKTASGKKSGFIMNAAGANDYGISLRSEDRDMIIVDGSADTIVMQKGSTLYDALHKGNTNSLAWANKDTISHNKLSKAAVTAMVSSGAWTKFPFDVKVKENLAGEVILGSSRIMPGQTTTYDVNAQVRVTGLTAGSRLTLALYKNGAIYQVLQDVVIPTSTASPNEHTVGGHAKIELLGLTDYVEIYYYLSGGTGSCFAGASNTFFEVSRWI